MQVVELLMEHPRVEAILGDAREAMGEDHDGYRNHVYRLLNFCRMLGAPEGEDFEQMAIAAACHDLGIWTAKTFDYLAPSCEAARSYLHAEGLDAWREPIEEMIELHHKVSAAGAETDLAEIFRRADLIDVSLGIQRFGLSRESIVKVQHQFPDRGFHARIARLALKRFFTHPLNPLPMFKA